MRGGERSGRRQLALRVARHVLGGLLTGAVVGYLAALVLPRRYPTPPGSYQAPIPPGAGLRSTERDGRDQAVTMPDATAAMEAG